MMLDKMAAAHACMLALKAHLSELQAELAQLLARHQALLEVLLWARQLVAQACGHVVCGPAGVLPLSLAL